MNGTRDMMITDWVDVCKPKKGSVGDAAWDRRMHIKSSQLADEETTFVIRPNGRVEHSTGRHDDELFAAMIAYELHLACEPFDINDNEDSDPVMSSSFIGGIDEEARARSVAIDEALAGDDVEDWSEYTI